MKLLCLVFAFVLPLASYGQTIRTLGYNTNGQIVVATNVVWTNAFTFLSNTVAAQVRSNLLLPALFLTNTNAADFNAALGLANSPDEGGFSVNSAQILWDNAGGGNVGLYVDDGDPMFGPAGASPWRSALGLGLAALTNSSNIAFRSAIGLPLTALTNTNAANFRSAIGALATNGSAAGLTNFPGVTTNISVVGTNNTNTLVFTNGLLMNVQ